MASSTAKVKPMGSYEQTVHDMLKQYEANRGQLPEGVRHRLIVASQDMDHINSYLERKNNGDEN